MSCTGNCQGSARRQQRGGRGRPGHCHRQWGAPGQQPAPVGTNTLASIKRTFWANVRGHPEERGGNRKLSGGLEWLETPMEDDWEREWFNIWTRMLAGTWWLGTMKVREDYKIQTLLICSAGLERLALVLQLYNEVDNATFPSCLILGLISMVKLIWNNFW